MSTTREIESGPLFITDLFQNKSIAYFESIFISLRFFKILLSFILCNFLVPMLKYQKKKKMFFCPQKVEKAIVAYLWQFGDFFFMQPRLPKTAQNFISVL